jgi:hypothetical protein
MGIAMSISGVHNVTGAHAHANLLGWVTMAIFGVYYALAPAKDRRAGFDAPESSAAGADALIARALAEHKARGPAQVDDRAVRSPVGARKSFGARKSA